MENFTDEELNIAIGQELKKLRTEKGLSKIRVSEMLGVSDVTIGYWESGRSTISAPRLKSYCKVLNISLSDFFKRIDQ